MDDEVSATPPCTPEPGPRVSRVGSVLLLSWAGLMGAVLGCFPIPLISLYLSRQEIAGIRERERDAAGLFRARLARGLSWIGLGISAAAWGLRLLYPGDSPSDP